MSSNDGNDPAKTGNSLSADDGTSSSSNNTSATGSSNVSSSDTPASASHDASAPRDNGVGTSTHGTGTSTHDGGIVSSNIASERKRKKVSDPSSLEEGPPRGGKDDYFNDGGVADKYAGRAAVPPDEFRFDKRCVRLWGFGALRRFKPSFPLLMWLPVFGNIEWRDFLFGDMFAGLTAGFLLIPQGERLVSPFLYGDTHPFRFFSLTSHQFRFFSLTWKFLQTAKPKVLLGNVTPMHHSNSNNHAVTYRVVHKFVD